MRPWELLKLGVERGATAADLGAALATVLRAAWGSVVEQDDRPWLALQSLDRWRAGEPGELDEALRIAAEARAAAAGRVAHEAHRVDLAGAYYLAVGVHTALEVASTADVKSQWNQPALRCI